MRYSVDVFTGKIQDYAGSRPSAIAKVQVDGGLMLTDLGLVGDEQAEKKFTVGPIARCATIRVNTISTGDKRLGSRLSYLSPPLLVRTSLLRG